MKDLFHNPLLPPKAFFIFFFKDQSDHNPLVSCLIGASQGLLGQHNLIGKGDADGKMHTRDMSCKSVTGTHTEQNIPKDSKDFCLENIYNQAQ